MNIKTIVVTDYQQNARVISDPKAGVGVVVDPGGEEDRIISACKGLMIEAIWITHAHLDHVGGVKRFCEKLGDQQGRRPEIIAHRIASQVGGFVELAAQNAGLSPEVYQNLPAIDRKIDQGESVSVGAYTGEVRYVPGHSPDHIVIYFESVTAVIDGQEAITGPILIAGDTLFNGSIGRTDLPGGNHDHLIQALHAQVLSLPDETVVLPGHGSMTMVGSERRDNPFL